jgi:hypothetical protein
VKLVYTTRFSIDSALSPEEVAETLFRSTRRPRWIRTAFLPTPRYLGWVEPGRFRLRTDSWDWRLDATVRARPGGTTVDVLAGSPLLPPLAMGVMLLLLLRLFLLSGKGWTPWRRGWWLPALIGLAMLLEPRVTRRETERARRFLESLLAS